MQINARVALWAKSKLALPLIALQTALSLAAISNATFIGWERWEKATIRSGMEEADAFYILSIGLTPTFNVEQTTVRDLARFRSRHDVKAATSALIAPLSGSVSQVGLSLQRGDRPVSNVNVYYFDEAGIEAFGLRLVEGRNFARQDIIFRNNIMLDRWPLMIVSKPLADFLFPGESPLGKTVYIGPNSLMIIGVVERLVGGSPRIPVPQFERSIIVPQTLVAGTMSQYLVRTASGMRDAVMRAAEQDLYAVDPSRIITEVRTAKEVRMRVYLGDLLLTAALGIATILLCLVNLMGLTGLASYWVAQRKLYTAVRRAIGATRSRIALEFVVENLMFVTVGVLLGTVLSYATNAWLMARFEMQRIEFKFIAIGALALILLGLLAVLGSAYQAARVPLGGLTSNARRRL